MYSAGSLNDICKRNKKYSTDTARKIPSCSDISASTVSDTNFKRTDDRESTLRNNNIRQLIIKITYKSVQKVIK